MSPTHPQTSAEFPAINWLGYGLDMSTLTPIDIAAVEKAVITAFQVITLEDSTRDVEIGSTTYKVPKNISVATDVDSVEGTYVTYKSGVEASQALQADASVSASYLAVKGSASASYSIDKSFTKDYQYALYSFNGDVYLAGLKNYGTFIEESVLTRMVKNLTIPFNDQANTIRQYRTLFENYGSHIITAAHYGARYQMCVWASNSTSSSVEKFSANVKASYNGISTNGDFDASVKTTSEYKTYEDLMQQTVTARGGGTAQVTALNSDLTSLDKYKAWTQTVNDNPALMSFQTVEIWALMALSENKAVTDAANAVEDAYNYIVKHPALHVTKATLSIESDWAEVGILTPSAIVKVDPAEPFDDPGNTLLCTTKVRWGKEHSHVQNRETVTFQIINDGSPIDIYISHGSDGSNGATGRASVTFNDNHYDNVGVSDNNWNTKWYYKCSVNSMAATV